MNAIFLTLLLTISYTTAIHITCHYVIGNPSIVGIVYSCYAECVKYDEGLVISDINGIHIDGKTEEDVKQVLFDDCDQLTGIPKDLENRFPYLTSLRLRKTKIKKLVKDDFRYFPHMISLEINTNLELTELPGDLFVHMEKIKKIYVNNNKINKIGNNILDPLPDLQVASFIGNTCVNEIAHKPEQITFLKAYIKIYCQAENVPCDTKNLDDRVCNLGESNANLWKTSSTYEATMNITYAKLAEYKTKCACKF